MPVILCDQHVMVPRHKDVLKLINCLDRRCLLTYDPTSRSPIGLKFIIQIINLDIFPPTQGKHILPPALCQYLRDDVIIKVLLIINGGAPNHGRPITTLDTQHDILIVSLGPPPLSPIRNHINIQDLEIPILTSSKLIFVAFTYPHITNILFVQILKMVNNFSLNIQLIHY